ncbi:MAG: hypothetical protein NXI21_02185 [Alphaproteobacteria bacterium]|nr:hypothetical protein [Alphaproteobacteria bacterium]
MDETDGPTIDARLAERLRALRTRRGWMDHLEPITDIAAGMRAARSTVDHAPQDGGRDGPYPKKTRERAVVQPSRKAAKSIGASRVCRRE